jgi:hypothetical protein
MPSDDAAVGAAAQIRLPFAAASNLMSSYAAAEGGAALSRGPSTLTYETTLEHHERE